MFCLDLILKPPHHVFTCLMTVLVSLYLVCLSSLCIGLLYLLLVRTHHPRIGDDLAYLVSWCWSSAIST